MSWPDSWNTQQRIERASSAVDAMVGNMMALIHLHEGNRIICYSDVLSSRIPKSHAAHAFHTFSSNMLNGELARICTFWDTPTDERNCIPSVVRLIDKSEVMAELRQRRIGALEAGQSLTSDAELTQSLADWAKEDTRARTDAVDEGLVAALAAAKELQQSDLVGSVRALRNRYLSHSLADEAKPNPPRKARYGDEGDLQEKTLPILDALNAAVRGSSFDWVSCREIAQRNATELWGACRFEIGDQ